jgi:hypothetical protein
VLQSISWNIPTGFLKEKKMADKNLVCKDCGVTFVFTEGEQAFYQEKGFTNEPQRCPDCRKAKKQQQNNRDYR